MSDLLVEIGCEELPASAVASGEEQLRAQAEVVLTEARLEPGPVHVFATPRRLAVLMIDLPERQAPSVVERRGPPVAKGIAPDGSFTKAAEGFARANDVEPSELVRVETDQGEYLFVRKQEEGAPLDEVAPALLGDLVGSLSFPKTMRWDGSGVRFPRPIRWLVAVLDDRVVEVAYAGLEAGRLSRGHRVFHPGDVEVAEAAAYRDALATASVIADRGERLEAVRAGAVEAAEGIGGRPILHDAVHAEVTDLVERPEALAGSFDRAYLELPRDVLITAMEAHQRYFPVTDERGDLLPGFVCVTNADPGNAGVIVAGNERVLRARLEDAKFFFTEDLKVSLLARAEHLSGIVFHARLGTLLDKTERVRALVDQVVGWLELDPREEAAARLAAEVYKADLLTHLVYEFPELQGVMGREYALRDPELRGRAPDALEPAAEAIREHYLPRFADDELPATDPGAVLALADRLDTLVGYTGIGMQPSGSEDPFALRRQATGFAAISLEREARVPLDHAIAIVHDAYVSAGVELDPLEVVTERTRELVVARAEGMLIRNGVDPLFTRAARDAPWVDLPDLAARARALDELHSAGDLHRLAVVHERAYNLSREAISEDVDPSVLTDDAEKDLQAALADVEPEARERAAARDYAGTLRVLVRLSETLSVFFDEVLVMAPDEALRRNRLALLRRTAGLFELVADFSGIEPKLLLGDRETG